MCYLVRQLPSELPASDAVAAPPLPSLRPRWAGAAAATLVGGLALAAALVSPQAGPERQTPTRATGAPAPVAARSSNLPATGGVEQTSLPMDDGVPTAADKSRAGFGHCHEGL
jgi:hypothetical protein